MRADSSGDKCVEDQLFSDDAIYRIGSGDITTEDTEKLKRSQQTKRAIQLAFVLDAVDATKLVADSGLSANVSRLQAEQPEAFARMLGDALFGIWAAQALVDLARDRNNAQLATAHQMRLTQHLAGLAFSCDTPVALHQVVFEATQNFVVPLVGGALLFESPHRIEAVEVIGGELNLRTDHGDVQLERQGSRVEVVKGDALWHESPVVCSQAADAGSPSLRVDINDIDPLGATQFDIPAAVPLVDRDNLAVWTRRLSKAWQLLVELDSSQAAVISDVLKTVIPKPDDTDISLEKLATTTPEAFGATAMRRPPNVAFCAATMVHEFRHAVLSALTDAHELFESDDSHRFYVPWKAEPRPFNAMLHGVFSFGAEANFWRKAMSRKDQNELSSTARFANLRLQVTTAWPQLEAAGLLNNSGRAFVEGIRESQSSWEATEIPGEVIRQAQQCVDLTLESFTTTYGSPAGVRA